MKSRKEMKQSAKKVLKKHYALLVFACLLVTFIGTEFAGSKFMLMQNETNVAKKRIQTGVASTELNGTEVIYNTLVSGNISQGEEEAEELKKETIEHSEKSGADYAFGRSRGVLASVINSLTSGSIFVTALAAVRSIIKASNHFWIMFFIVISVAFMGARWLFLRNMFDAVIRRIFLESRIYGNVQISRFAFFFRVKKWMHVSFVMFLKFVYQMLWFLTIVGGFIKFYSYKMVPFIIAENPSLKGKEVISISRRMMDGHKWECFRLDLSFFGWYLLGMVTMGISDLLFTNPYILATYSEYYTQLRTLLLEKNEGDKQWLNDRYLFEKAEKEVIDGAYGDIFDLMQQPEEPVNKISGIRQLFSHWFGVILFYDAKEKQYERNEIRKVKIARYQDIMNGMRYPGRLFTIPEKEKRVDDGQFRYLRRYSIWSLLLMFFFFALIGWIWEVSLHLVSDGIFVNRGVLHGPWLPIYGAGGTLILLFLNRQRKNPVKEFVSVIIVCGIVEYYTSYILEVTQGKKWWDYSGYFLNLNGRICAEGLFVFGLGGMAIVYVVAPVLDDYVRKMQTKVLVSICMVCVIAFVTDSVYSLKHPNTGKGITDYQSRLLHQREMGKRDRLC